MWFDKSGLGTQSGSYDGHISKNTKAWNLICSRYTWVTIVIKYIPKIIPQGSSFFRYWKNVSHGIPLDIPWDKSIPWDEPMGQTHPMGYVSKIQHKFLQCFCQVVSFCICHKQGMHSGLTFNDLIMNLSMSFYFITLGGPMGWSNGLIPWNGPMGWSNWMVQWDDPMGWSNGTIPLDLPILNYILSSIFINDCQGEKLWSQLIINVEIFYQAYLAIVLIEICIHGTGLHVVTFYGLFNIIPKSP